MRRALFLAAMMSAQSALADDLSHVPETRLRGDWAGAYAGIFGGAALSAGTARLDSYAGMLLPADVSYGLFPRTIAGSYAGGAFGASAGLNFQWGSFVGGIEGDIGFAATSAHLGYSRVDNVPGSPFPGVNTDTRYDTDFGAIGTLRLRGGYAFGDTLVFGTAGAAAGNVENRFGLSLRGVYTSPDWSASGLRLGYTVGAGVERRLTNATSVKFEMLYVNLADRVVRGADPAAFPGESISYRFANDLLIPRLAINVKF